MRYTGVAEAAETDSQGMPPTDRQGSHEIGYVEPSFTVVTDIKRPRRHGSTLEVDQAVTGWPGYAGLLG